MDFRTFERVSQQDYLAATTDWGSEYITMIDSVIPDGVGVITLDDARSQKVRGRLRKAAAAMGLYLTFLRSKAGTIAFEVALQVEAIPVDPDEDIPF